MTRATAWLGLANGGRFVFEVLVAMGIAGAATQRSVQLASPVMSLSRIQLRRVSETDRVSSKDHRRKKAMMRGISYAGQLP